MIQRFAPRHLVFSGALLMLASLPLAALPTMIRLGYPNCVSCHIAPQGGGVLNEYGRGIDQAQSLQRGEYKARTGDLARFLTANGRITQDFRNASSGQLRTTPSDALVGIIRSRFFYRNVTKIGKGIRATATIVGDPNPALRPNRIYERAVRPDKIHFGTALLQYRPHEHWEFAIGRDQLPTGIYNGDQAAYIRSANRLGYYDYPTQAKFFWWGSHHQVTTFAFRPSGEESTASREAGGGILAEYDVLRNGRTIVGLTFTEAQVRSVDRRVMGTYTRLGFGSWGILAEHDVTDRNVLASATKFRQQTSYGQVFWAAREWLVPSLTMERLHVDNPYPSHLIAWKAGVSARLSRSFTVALNGGAEKNFVTGDLGPVFSVSLAMKTP